jgi:thioredoxin-related protein
MNAVTYSDQRTVEFVKDYMIPLRVIVGEDRFMSTKFRIQYTPTIMMLDGDGKELYREVGFHPLEEFVPMLMLGIGKAYTNANRCDKALKILTKLIDRYPASKSIPSAASLKEFCLKRLPP